MTNYFHLQLKRSVKAFSHMIVSIIMMACLAVFLAWGISQWFNNIQMLNAVTIAVVFPGENDQNEMIMNLVEDMDSVTSICTFDYIDSDQMLQGLRDETYDVGIELTDDFYDDVNDGINTPLTIYFSGDEDMSKSVFKELLYDGLGFVQVTESAIYSVTDLRKTYSLKMTKGETEEFLTEFYVMNIFKRGNAFSDTVLSTTGQVNLTQYYIVVGLAFFLLLGSLLFGFLYKEDENELLQALSLRGITPGFVSMVRLAVMWIYTYGVSLLAYLGCCIYFHFGGAEDTEPLMTFHPLAILQLLLVTLAMTAFTHAIYSLAKTRTMGTLLVMGINLFMLILAGGILPIAYLPKPVQWLGNILPLRFWMEHMQNVFFAKGYGLGALMDLIFAGVCLAVAMLATRHRLFGRLKYMK